MIAVVAIAKDEAPYIVEWLAHHRAIGVDHFIIFDNESSDGTSDILRKLDAAGVLTRVDWPTLNEYPHFEGQKIGPQVPAYRRGLEIAKTKGAWQWVGVLDLDEFVVLQDSWKLQDVLNRYAWFGGVGLNWRMFGSNGLKSKPDGLITKAFTKRLDEDDGVNRHVKTFSRVAITEELNIHLHRLSAGYSVVDTGLQKLNPWGLGFHDRAVYEGAWVNHYFVKSEEEFLTKRARGKANHHPDDDDRLRSLDEFKIYDRNDAEDLTILRFQDSARQQIDDLNEIIAGRRSGGSRRSLRNIPLLGRAFKA